MKTDIGVHLLVKKERKKKVCLISSATVGSVLE